MGMENARPLLFPAPKERTPRTFIAPCPPEPAGVRSARRPGAQRVRMQSATWGGFRHEQAVGAAATGDRSRSKGGFMGAKTRCFGALHRRGRKLILSC